MRLMRKFTPVCLVIPLVLVGASLLSASELLAPPNARKFAITDPEAVDGDYAYQGEYTGLLAIDRRCYVSAGLQVIARGDGKFDAVRYRGGLPGHGWDGSEPATSTGELLDGVLTLNSDDRYTIMTDGTVATVYDSQGSELGQLQKTVRVSPTLGAAPPANAIVLFDGTSTENLVDGHITEEGLLDVGVTTKMDVGDFRMHLEFRLPYMPYATGQSRSNSGVYIQRRYELQVLDSFGLEGVANECGGMYRQRPPDVNMCFPPLTWQTYDIWFTAARFDDDGNKTANARITVLHNGVPIHCDYEIVAKTGAGQPEGPERMPILLQNHGNPVRYRNIWIILDPPRVAKTQASQPYPKKHCFPRIRRVLCRIRCHCRR
jgi:hypothetical protein